jgi:hypothetical protein
MIEIFIFFVHIVAWLYAFTFTWQNKGLKNAILSILILGFIFIIIWTITSPFAQLIMPEKWKSIYFTKDTLALILLVIPESIFYYYYFLRDKIKTQH